MGKPMCPLVDLLAVAVEFHLEGLRRTREGTMTGRPPIPTEERTTAWRRVCVAYNQWRQAGAIDQEAHEAAVAAAHTVLPLPW